ncbi:MAG: hypothetical protein ACREOR_08085, partial [Candidatus Binatia bacterium]
MIFAVATVVAALELSIRLLPIDKLPGSLPVVVHAMQLHAGMFYRSDPDFRYITGPNLDLLVQHPDFKYRVQTKLTFGQAGFRGGSLGGPVWGVALGDSFTFGMGVEQAATWVAQLANLTRREV